MAGVEDGADALGDDVVGHLLQVVVEEARVVHAGLLRERLDAGAGGQGGARLVEADVPVRADPQQLEVDPAGFRQRPVVGLAGADEVLGGAVGAHEGGLRQSEGLDDLAEHHGAVGLGVPGGQADVLVELADPGPGDVDPADGDLGGEGLVDGQGSRAGRHAEQGVGLAADQGGHGLRDELAACLGVRDDDNFHAVPADLEWWCGIDQSSRACRLREGSRRPSMVVPIRVRGLRAGGPSGPEGAGRGLVRGGAVRGPAGCRGGRSVLPAGRLRGRCAGRGGAGRAVRDRGARRAACDGRGESDAGPVRAARGRERKGSVPRAVPARTAGEGWGPGWRSGPCMPARTFLWATVQDGTLSPSGTVARSTFGRRVCGSRRPSGRCLRDQGRARGLPRSVLLCGEGGSFAQLWTRPICSVHPMTEPALPSLPPTLRGPCPSWILLGIRVGKVMRRTRGTLAACPP